MSVRHREEERSTRRRGKDVEASEKKTVAEDPMDNDEEWQEEEVRVG